MPVEDSKLYKKLDLLIENDVCFAIYRSPQQPVRLIIQQAKQPQIIPSLEKLIDITGFVVSPFNISESNALICINPDIIVEGNDDICSYLANIDASIKVKNKHKYFINDDVIDYDANYKSSFEVFLQALQQKRFEKLVLSRKFLYKNQDDFSVGVAFNEACKLYQSEYISLFHTPITGAWLGCSPEILLSGNKSKYKTVALAGTLPIDSDTNRYRWDEKNLLEQNIVSIYLQEQLNNCGFSFTETPLKTISAGKIIHLKTEFEFKPKLNTKPNLKPDASAKNSNTIKNLGTLLAILHPTPAVCGFPKKSAYDFIIENESYNREYYSGFLGYIDSQANCDLYVNLRCMKIDKQHLQLFAGGGLLASSDFATEWKETEQKLQTILNLIYRVENTQTLL